MNASRLTRDLIQEVAVVQGLVALVSGNLALDESGFAAYTRNFRRGHEHLRRVYLVRDGKVLYTDRPAASSGSFSRLEERLAPTGPIVIRAMVSGSAIMDGPFKTTEGEDVFTLCAADLWR